jgi:NhaP-type Na+/H+ or K+/H+ antiporter
VSASDIVLGLGITVILAVGCQIIAAKFRLPAIVLLLPAGFIAGHYITEVNPEKTLGSAFSPLVGLGVAIILFDGGLDLNFRELEGHSQRVVRRLLLLGIPITFAGAAVLAWLFLDISGRAAIMLGAIVIVSGPTVVTPLLEAARPGQRVSRILGWEGLTIDPIGAIIGAVLFQGLV